MFTGCEGCANLGTEDFLGNEVEGCMAGMIEPQRCVLNKVKQQNNGLKKQNKQLEHTFLEILKICNEQADCMHVLELQNRIKAVLNGSNA